MSARAVYRPAFELLGREIGGRADERSSPSRGSLVVEASGETEVGEIDVLRAVE